MSKITSSVPNVKFEKAELDGCIVEETSFATLFPKYVESYLVQIWPAVEKVLKEHGIRPVLDVKEGSMTVTNSKETWDPYAIIKARDFIKLLSRKVEISQAVKIFQDDMAYDIIKIGNIIRNKQRFVKRRQRLIGPNGKTIKALELLTGCYINVQGNTVSCMGPYKGCAHVRTVVEDCMNNVHPIYGIKRLLVQRELEKRPEMKEKDWGKFLPIYKKKPVSTTKESRKKQKDLKKAMHDRKTKVKTPYTAEVEQPVRAEDAQLTSGAYWGDRQQVGKRAAERRQDDQRKAKRRKTSKEEGDTPVAEDDE